MTDNPGQQLSLPDRLSGLLLRLVSKRTTARPHDHDETYFRRGPSEARTFLRRFSTPIDFRGKRVLDYGCGYGPLAFHLAQEEGATVTGVDIDPARIDFARKRLSSDHPDLAGAVEFKLPEEVNGGQFDIVVSKDSFQHFSDPEDVLSELIQLTAPGGLISIGLGPFWKSPYGGAINFMTRLPWAHLIFSEKVIMRGRKRYRPEEDAQTYGDTLGGLNKMTLGRFRRLVDGSGLKVLSFRTNASSGVTGSASRLLAAIPGCREFFTLNAYVLLSVPNPGEETAQAEESAAL
ncbi:MAG: hypothetical protein DRI30_00665 [Chloroflexi bacterium]|nr:MAG: hypothetical protein DRI30_00665 [Chloroflexota bacterium]